jgi:uncharacterized protein
MARAPSAAGKTRLAPHLSRPRLLALGAALLADTLGAVARLPPDVDAFVFFTPDEAGPEMAALVEPAVPCIPQGPGHLGQRMRSALDQLLGHRRYGTAMLVGADIPLLGAEHVVDARDTLQASGGVVLGPADDGGYYLIGMTSVHGGLFEAIEWGTDSVLTDTLRAADRLGLEARLIRSAYDIDTIDDLLRLERDLQWVSSVTAPNLRRWFKDG